MRLELLAGRIRDIMACVVSTPTHRGNQAAQARLAVADFTTPGEGSCVRQTETVEVHTSEPDSTCPLLDRIRIDDWLHECLVE